MKNDEVSDSSVLGRVTVLQVWVYKEAVRYLTAITKLQYTTPKEVNKAWWQKVKTVHQFQKVVSTLLLQQIKPETESP